MNSPASMSLISAAISLGGFVIALATLSWRLRKDKREHGERVRKQLEEMIEAFEEKITLRFGQVDDKRRQDIRTLHDRIDKLENRTFDVLTERLTNVEKELSGVAESVRRNTRILTTIEENYIQGGKK